MTVREIPLELCARVRESANRPHLVLGAEPIPVFLGVGMMAFWMICFLSFWGVLSGFGLALFTLSILRAMAKKDPRWLQIGWDKRWRQGYWPRRVAPLRRGRR